MISGPRYRFGSGYLFAEGRVLTAAHVLVPADVRADVPGDLLVLRQGVVQRGDQCEVALWDTLTTAAEAEDIRWITGRVEALDEQLDIAVIYVPEVGAGLGPVTFGRLEGDQPVEWTAVGFPLAGKEDAGRQPEQVWGLVAPLTAAFFSGRLGLTVGSRHARPNPGGDSGWAGLSGAAVFVGRSLVGVVVEDLPGFIGSLTARRIENAIASPKLASALTGLHVTAVSAELGLGITNYVFGASTATLGASESQILNFVEYYLGTTDHAVPFEGRQKELATLDDWILNGKPYRLLVAPAGRGKSALVCHWLARLSQSSVQAPLFVFVPVSRPFQTNLESTCLATVCSRLAHHYNTAVPRNGGLGELRQFITQRLRQEPNDKRQLLIVIDGLDEAANWDFGPNLFPPVPPPYLRILLTTRPRASDLDNGTWLGRLGWTNQIAAIDDFLASWMSLIIQRC